MDLINKGILNIIKYKQLMKNKQLFNLEQILLTYFLFLPVDRDLTSSEEEEEKETSQPAKKQNNSRKKKVS